MDIPGKDVTGAYLEDKDIDDLGLLDYNMNYSVPGIKANEIDDFTITQAHDPSIERKLMFFKGIFVYSINENTVVKKNLKAKKEVNI